MIISTNTVVVEWVTFVFNPLWLHPHIPTSLRLDERHHHYHYHYYVDNPDNPDDPDNPDNPDNPNNSDNPGNHLQ